MTILDTAGMDLKSITEAVGLWLLDYAIGKAKAVEESLSEESVKNVALEAVHMAAGLKDKDCSEVKVKGMRDLVKNGLLGAEEVADTVALEAFLATFQPLYQRRSVEVDLCFLDAAVREWGRKQKGVWRVAGASQEFVQSGQKGAAIARELLQQ